MNIIVCIDDDGGLLFNKRRQSKDKAVIEKVHEIVRNNTLWITDFSKALFTENVVQDNEMLDKAETDDFCFVENIPLSIYADKITCLYLFRWNRKYPSDFKLDIDYSAFLRNTKIEEFVGNSHEKITLEVWER